MDDSETVEVKVGISIMTHKIIIGITIIIVIAISFVITIIIVIIISFVIISRM